MNRPIPILMAALLAMATFGAAPAAQAAECKGRSKTTCSTDAQCSWVDPFTRKDGAKVKGYCRAKRSVDSAISGGRKQAKDTRNAAEAKARDKGDEAKRKGERVKSKDARERSEKARKKGKDKLEKGERGRSDPKGKAKGHEMDKASKKLDDQKRKASAKQADTKKNAKKVKAKTKKKAKKAKADSKKKAKKSKKAIESTESQ